MMARFCHASNEDPDQTAHAHLSTIFQELQFFTLQFIYKGKKNLCPTLCPTFNTTDMYALPEGES